MKKILFLLEIVVASCASCSPSKTYNITWKNDDGSILSTTKVGENELPKYDKETPSKKEAEEYRYTFDGWDPVVVKASKDATYTATYKATRFYKITWLNYDGNKLCDDSKVDEGQLPIYPGPTPTKPAEADKHFIYKGWDKKLTPATGNTTYTATYTALINIYEIKWLNDDGTPIKTTQVKHGDMPSFGPEAPKKAPTATKTYTFNKWEPELEKATKDTSYKATYNESVRYYSVSFDPNGGKWKDGTTKPKTIKCEYNATPTPPIEVPFKDSDQTKCYPFKSWGNILPVTTDITYKAIYSEEDINKTIDIVCTDGCSVYDESKKDYVPELKIKVRYHDEAKLKIKNNDTANALNITTFTVNGSTSNDYNFDCVEGNLSFITNGNTSIRVEPINRNIVAKLVYKYNPSYDANQRTVLFNHNGNNDLNVFWGNGWDKSNKHTYTTTTIENYNIYITSTKITEIRISSSNGKLSSGNNYITDVYLYDSITTIPSYAFYKLDNLTNVKVGDNVTSIQAHAFYYSLNLISVNFTERSKLSSIGEWAFSFCYGLRNNKGNFYLPPSLKTISKDAFKNATAITKITSASTNLTLIDMNAFLGTHIKVFDFSHNNVVPTLGANSLPSIDTINNIYVKSELLNEYKKADYWKDYAAKISVIKTSL